MKAHFDINRFIKDGQIENELDLERALIADRKLRLLSKDSEHFKTLRQKLREIIRNYEDKNWNDLRLITKDKIQESDLAEKTAENERMFLKKRKGLIKENLKKLNLNQQELGQILGHKSKTYMSELINGISPFSLKDLIIINKLLKIEMNSLIPLFLSEADQSRINIVIEELKNAQLDSKKKDFVFI